MKTKSSRNSLLSSALLLCILLACRAGSAVTAVPVVEPSEAAPVLATDTSAPPTDTATPLPAPTETAIPTDENAPAPLGERSFEDRPDDQPGLYQVHLLYVVPAESKDQERDLNGRINTSVEAVNLWFSEQTGGSSLRFDTYQGQLDITFVTVDMTSDEVYDASVAQYGGAYWIRDILEAKLSDMTLFQPGKIYLALFEIDRHPSTCADSAHPPDLMGRMAGLYPSAVVEAGWNCADQPFGAGLTYTDMGLIHETVHLLGFASSCGFNPTSAGNISHTGDDNRDLMWAPDDADTRYWDTDHMLLDPGNDDYFNHTIPNCPDLADSAFLEPLPADPQTPTGWPDAWKLP
jgi:hypothetical protein